MNILITGAGKGIGYEISKHFANCEDANLFIISRSRENLNKLSEELKTINSRARIIMIPFDIKNFVKNIFPEELNVAHLDILINNAGILVRKKFHEIETEEFINMINTNFLAPVMLIKHCINKRMMGGDISTHVVNIGSMGGFQGSNKFKGLSMYSATKAAIASFTECLATEYAVNNIFFNCLALGAVQTEMLHEAFPGYKAPLSAKEMGAYIADFALNGHKYFNGKILPVSVSVP